jgi:hypothetical protein
MIFEPFSISESVTKLYPYEDRLFILNFDPKIFGYYRQFICHGPGGERINITVQGVCGSPIAIYTEFSNKIISNGIRFVERTIRFYSKVCIA